MTMTDTEARMHAALADSDVTEARTQSLALISIADRLREISETLKARRDG